MVKIHGKLMFIETFGIFFKVRDIYWKGENIEWGDEPYKQIKYYDGEDIILMMNM